MDEKYLQRGAAPFADKVWELLDNCVAATAKARLCGRRLLHVEGPYGLGLKAIAGVDEAVKDKNVAVDGVALSAGAASLVAALQASFTLPARDIAAFEGSGVPFSLKAVAKAAVACAAQEDALVFGGSKALGCDGITSAGGARSAKLRAWNQVGVALDDVIRAITALDEAGFNGPYALALSPARYNLLFRPYPDAGATELERVQAAITDGIIKTLALAGGGVLLASNSHYASIVLGQDLVTGFVGARAGEYEFVISESLALRLNEPAAICVLKEG